MKDDARKYEILIENYIYKPPPQTQTISFQDASVGCSGVQGWN